MLSDTSEKIFEHTKRKKKKKRKEKRKKKKKKKKKQGEPKDVKTQQK